MESTNGSVPSNNKKCREINCVTGDKPGYNCNYGDVVMWSR